MPKQDRIPELVEELRHYFADVQLVMEAADTIEDLMDVAEHYKEFYHEEHDLRMALIEKTKKEGWGVGKWITTRTWEHDGDPYCSNCGFEQPYMRFEKFKFCPNCGARMEVSEDG